ncbi:RIM20 [Candida theae]|uniref:RIM20 n=1 Tax=Candida theae TaxID=1198502 RepID=A0AAD5FYA7_9ASCO|nr:RIM20 [Candida theae]KAI5957989.1 RIM20 [Candida theae]
MTTNLLDIPLKQSRPLDLGEELSKTITARFFQPAASFKSDLSYITSIRNEVTKISNDITSVSTTNKAEILSHLDKYYEYLSSLRSIEEKFPHDCVEFAWFITIYNSPIGPIKLRSFKYEQLCIIFQIGVTYSQLALRESRSTDEGLRNSCQYFQNAAGCFSYLFGIISNEGAVVVAVEVSGDLLTQTILCLTQLMLAEAQETIWQKAKMSGTSKDSVIARLSYQTSQYYAEALSFAKQSDFIKLEWVNHITVKRFHFLAAAHYRSSLVALNSFQYGEQVAHLRVASNAIAQALKHKKYVNECVVEDATGLAETIRSAYKVAEKDNDLIYLNIVPADSELKPLNGVSMVKANESVINENVQVKPLFKDLLPYVVVHSAQAFKERTEEHVRVSVYEPIQNLNHSIGKFLNDRNLPASIDALEQPENLPEVVVRHSREIINSGGVQVIETSLGDIRNLSMQCSKLVAECQNRIDLDKREDEMLREKQGYRVVHRSGLGKLEQVLIGKIQRMRDYLEEARKGDEVVVRRYMEIKNVLEVYTGGFQSLNRFVPNSNYVKLDQKLSNLVSELRRRIDDLQSLQSSRQKFSRQLDIKVKNDSILPKLVQEYKRNEKNIYDKDGHFNSAKFELVYEDHLKLLSSDLSFLDETRVRQTHFEQEIDNLNNEFIHEFNTTVTSTQRARQEALQTLDTAFVKYNEILNNISEGVNFYTDFITKGNVVLVECEDYLSKRRLEGREIELQIVRSQEQGENAAGDGPSIISSVPKSSNVWNPNSDIKFG